MKVMRLVDVSTGKMECRVCRSVHFASIRPHSGGKLYRKNWECVNGCRLPGQADGLRKMEMKDYEVLLDRAVFKADNPLEWVLPGGKLLADLSAAELSKLAKRYARGRDMPPPARMPGAMLLVLQKMQWRQQEALEQVPPLLVQILRSERAVRFRPGFRALGSEAFAARALPIAEDVINKYWGGCEPEMLEQQVAILLYAAVTAGLAEIVGPPVHAAETATSAPAQRS